MQVPTTASTPRSTARGAPSIEDVNSPLAVIFAREESDARERWSV